MNRKKAPLSRFYANLGRGIEPKSSYADFIQTIYGMYVTAIRDCTGASEYPFSRITCRKESDHIKLAIANRHLSDTTIDNEMLGEDDDETRPEVERQYCDSSLIKKLAGVVEMMFTQEEINDMKCPADIFKALENSTYLKNKRKEQVHFDTSSLKLDSNAEERAPEYVFNFNDVVIDCLEDGYMPQVDKKYAVDTHSRESAASLEYALDATGIARSAVLTNGTDKKSTISIEYTTGAYRETIMHEYYMTIDRSQANSLVVSCASKCAKKVRVGANESEWIDFALSIFK